MHNRTEEANEMLKVIVYLRSKLGWGMLDIINEHFNGEYYVLVGRKIISRGGMSWINYDYSVTLE